MRQHPHATPDPATHPTPVIHPVPPSGTEGRQSALVGSPALRTRREENRGRVVRITHSYAYHVTDEDALLHAAAGRGWRPLPAAELSSDDPRDLTGAVMSLSGPPDVVGTRTLEHREEPVRSGAERAAATGGTPDFSVLFALRDLPLQEGHRHIGELRRLTPRSADLLHTTLVVLADQAYDDVQHLGDRFLPGIGPAVSEVFDRLPPSTWTVGHRWRRRMARAFDDLAHDLVRGHPPTPACAAEEVALRLAVEDVPGHLEGLCEEDDHQSLPQHDDDYDYSHLLPPNRRCAFAFEGADGLGRPAAWFAPFDDHSARDPRRGFRR
ncbi:hypothetical protein [Streptomyces vinaceus]|uniref:hypothetical protein n=1 Tax=Streptomyces vinaceus TaxID=1960 RepID=UPI0038156979